jgi:phosphatidylglycerophosphate synthase
VLDRRARAVIAPPLAAGGARLAALGVAPLAITVLGFGLGAGACVAAGLGAWTVALVLWLGNRLADGLDGPVARAAAPSDLGGFLDIVADFTVYGGFLVGVAVALPSARLAALVLLATYYVSGTAFLALSSLLERRRHDGGDERSLRFVGGLAEGTETILVYAAICLFSGQAAAICWAFAAAVALTAIQRVALGIRLLRRPLALDHAHLLPPERVRSAASGGRTAAARVARPHETKAP